MTFETKLEKRYEDGQKMAMRSSIIDFLSEISEVPEQLKDKIQAIDDLQTLQYLNKKAARASSIEEFEESL